MDGPGEGSPPPRELALKGLGGLEDLFYTVRMWKLGYAQRGRSPDMRRGCLSFPCRGGGCSPGLSFPCAHGGSGVVFGPAIPQGLHYL